MEFRNPSIDVIPITQISLKFKIKGFHYKLFFDSEFSKAKSCQTDECLNKSGQTRQSCQAGMQIFSRQHGDQCVLPPASCLLPTPPLQSTKFTLSPDFPIIIIFYPFPLTLIFIPLGSALVQYLPQRIKTNVPAQELSNNGESIHFLQSSCNKPLYNSNESVSSMPPDWIQNMNVHVVASVTRMSPVR